MSSTLCYNRGCGRSYNPRDNSGDSCTFHPGAPFFHDAYKGWTCCGKKCTDFTEFLNTPGCSRGPHSNVKPEEPESITGKKDDRNLEEQLKDIDHDNQKTTRASIESRVQLARPDFDGTPVTRLSPVIAAALKNASQLVQKVAKEEDNSHGETSLGESCKNGGCKATFDGQESGMPNECTYHPGVPIFHEGMKYWSCCQRKTSDFQSFLDQPGCRYGKHKWKKDSEGSAQVDCRYDWHQTATHVVVAIYGKKYDPEVSSVDLSPVRLRVHIYFPEQGGAFDLDLELRGIVTVAESTAHFMGTKVEVKMKKAEPGSWAKLDITKAVAVVKDKAPSPPKSTTSQLAEEVDDLDLDDVDLLPTKIELSKEASGGRTQNEII